MKVVLFFGFILLSKCVSAQTNIIDTTIVLGTEWQKTLTLDSVQFVHLKIEFDQKIVQESYNSKLICESQNSLFQRLELSNIDTLYLDGFLEKFDIGSILATLRSVNTVYIRSYGYLQILQPIHETASTIKSIQILATDFVEIDLKNIQMFKTKALTIDLEQENKSDHILLINESFYLDSLVLDIYFPKFRKFTRGVHFKKLKKRTKISQTPISFNLHSKNKTIVNPHNKKL